MLRRYEYQELGMTKLTHLSELVTRATLPATCFLPLLPFCNHTRLSFLVIVHSYASPSCNNNPEIIVMVCWT